MKKTFLILGISIAVLLIIVSAAIGLYLGPIAKIAMERVGPRITQVSIKVDSVDMSILTGSAKIKGLIVGNPTGYSAPQAISVGTISISMDPFSVTSNKIMVHSIKVESPQITLEGGISSNNLTKILNNVNGAPKNGAAQSTTDTTNKPASKIEVDDVLITGAKVSVMLPGLGNRTLPLPDIHLTDLGKGNDGLTPAQLISAIFKAIITGTVQILTSSVGNISQGVQSIGKGALNTVGNSITGITGLFGK